VHELREAIQVAVLTAPSEQRDALIHDYPDTSAVLLATDAESRAISADRGSLGINELDDVETQQVLELSKEYRERFGMPFVYFLDTNDTVASIVNAGLRRLANSDVQEHRVALTEIVEIANDRFDILLADANPVRSAWDRKFTEVE
ncbi:2-oxo-4-hydroxy-4-carboxy-5-ureidoimidazoline decarboxylase, partial [Mycolicibacterium goodii]